MAAEGAEAPKADEWVEKLDASSGNYYYYNRTTKDTSWDKPEVYKPATKAAGSANGDWNSKVDPGSGQNYYYNKKTKETAWEPPEGWVDEEASAAEPAAAAEDTLTHAWR